MNSLAAKKVKRLLSERDCFRLDGLVDMPNKKDVLMAYFVICRLAAPQEMETEKHLIQEGEFIVGKRDLDRWLHMDSAKADKALQMLMNLGYIHVVELERRGGLKVSIL